MKKLIFIGIALFSIHVFSQRVSTLSGTVNANIYTANNGYNNGLGNQSTFLFPQSIATDSKGNCYVIDDFPVIRKVDATGFTSPFSGVAILQGISYMREYVDGANPRYQNLTAIATDANDNVYVIDNNRIRKITPLGVASTILATQTDLRDASGLVVAANGDIYVANTGRRNILKVTQSGQVSIFATGFGQPKDLCFDAQGNLYVTDVSSVKKITPNGVVSNHATGFGDANGIEIDSLGNLFVCDSLFHLIKRIDTNQFVSNYAGSSQGFQDSSTLFFWRLPRFSTPQGLAIDKFGNLYVPDRNNNRIRLIAKN